MNINCKISFLVYNLNQNSLHSCQDDLNCSRCGSRCETLPRKKLKDSGNNATGHCWSLYKCHDGRWEKIFPHFFHRPKCLFHSFFTKFSKNLPFHRLHKTPKKPTYFTKNFTGETGDILVASNSLKNFVGVWRGMLVRQSMRKQFVSHPSYTPSTDKPKLKQPLRN